MRLAVSTLGLPDGGSPGELSMLRERGVTGLEVLPTLVWPGWEGATPKAARSHAAMLAGEGFGIPALQAILFGRPDATLFGDRAAREALVAHLARVAELAAALGAGVLVLGAPRNRLRGDIGHDEAVERAVPVLRSAAEACHAHGCSLCLEPNPPRYGADFATTVREARSVVTAVGHPAFGLHLDTGGMSLSGEDPASVIRAEAPRFRHFHASEPDLAPVPTGAVDHAVAAAALREVGYEAWVSLEMKAPAGAVGLNAALDAFASAYGGARR